jgi:dUTP pyrophosphatase
VKVKIKKLSQNVTVPSYQTTGSACFDLVASEDTIVQPGETVAIPTGLAFELPEGYQMKVLPRSGISLKTPLKVIIGTVDNDFRGEVKVIMQNTAVKTRITHEYHTIFDPKFSFDNSTALPNDTYKIFKGDRVAQAEIVPIVQAEFETMDELSETQRGNGGFGSTGV